MAAALPAIAPMKAISTEVPTDDGWAFEVKWDGMRVVAAVGDEVRLTSAAGHDATDRFPELADLAPHLGSSGVVLDGEVVALDGRGRADRQPVRRRGPKDAVRHRTAWHAGAQ